MGATSVTGKGRGAAYNNKGPQNGRNVYVPLLSPHVVAAGFADLSGTTLTVTFPTPLPGSGAADATGKYVIMLTNAEASTTVPQVTAVTNNADGDFESFQITGASGKNAFWAVMTKGF